MAHQSYSSLTNHSEIDSSSEPANQENDYSNLKLPRSDTTTEIKVHEFIAFDSNTESRGNGENEGIHSTRNTNSFDWNGSWVWEITGATLSMICMALLVGFLKYVDGKMYQNWEYSISPNAVASVIVTIAKGAVLIPVSSCLSQMKWNHSESRPRPIYNMQMLDQASRGPWGAIEVIWRMKPGLATVGAMLTILAVAVDPFAQQILAFPSNRVQLHNETAYVQAAHGYITAWSRAGDFRFEGTQHELSPNEVEPTMQLAILNGLAQTYKPLGPVCPTKDCEYPDFVTFGTCSTCEDVTAASTQTCRAASPQDYDDFSIAGLNNTSHLKCTYTSPTGFNLTPGILSSGGNATYLYANRQPWTSICTEEEFFIQGKQGPIVSFFSAKYNGTLIYTHRNATVNEPRPALTECSVYWCEREYTNNSVSLNRFSGEATRMQYLYAIGDFSGPDGQYQTMAPFGKNKTLSEDSVYTMDTTSLNAIISKLMVFFNGTLIPTPGLSSGLLSPLFLYESQNLTQSLHSMDEAMTDNIRSASEISNRIAGRAYSNVTFIHVRWPWIILPVAVVVLSHL